MSTETESPFDSSELETRPAAGSKKGLVIAGIALLLLLAGAAFMGGRLLNSRRSGSLPGAGSLTLNGDGGMVEIKVKDAEELPDRPPELAGVFDHRKDNSIFLGTGNLGIATTVKDGAAPESAATFDGPVIEVVISRETVIYRDATMDGGPMPEPGGEIEQKVEPGSIEDLGETSMVSVWGRKSGDRVIADVILYSSPMIYQKPPK